MNLKRIREVTAQLALDEVFEEIAFLEEREEVLRHLINKGAKTMKAVKSELDVLIEKGVTNRERANDIIYNLIEATMEREGHSERN